MIRILPLALLLAATAAEARPRHLSWDWLAYQRWMVPRPMTRAEMEFERCRLANTPTASGNFGTDWRAARIVELDCALKYGVRVLP